MFQWQSTDDVQEVELKKSPAKKRGDYYQEDGLEVDGEARTCTNSPPEKVLAMSPTKRKGKIDRHGNLVTPHARLSVVDRTLEDDDAPECPTIIIEEETHRYQTKKKSKAPHMIQERRSNVGQFPEIG